MITLLILGIIAGSLGSLVQVMAILVSDESEVRWMAGIGLTALLFGVLVMALTLGAAV